MLILITILCCWLGWETSIVRERKAVRQEIGGKPGITFVTAAEGVSRLPPGVPRKQVSFLRAWLGDQAIQEISYTPQYHDLSAEDRERLARVFPEASLTQSYVALEPCHPGCFPRGTLVETPRGRRAIEAIETGTLVTTIGPDGERGERAVQSVFITDNMLWLIRTEAGELLTTKTQPLCLADGTIRGAGELEVGDSIRHLGPDGVHNVKVLEAASTGRMAKVFNVVLGNSEIFVAGGYLARSKPPPEIAALGASE